jgi:hypothetical protein
MKNFVRRAVEFLSHRGIPYSLFEKHKFTKEKVHINEKEKISLTGRNVYITFRFTLIKVETCFYYISHEIPEKIYAKNLWLYSPDQLKHIMKSYHNFENIFILNGKIKDKKLINMVSKLPKDLVLKIKSHNLEKYIE